MSMVISSRRILVADRKQDGWPTSHWLFCVLVASVALVGSSTGYAQIARSWNTGNGDWFVGTNWSPIGVPGPLDGAFIGNFPGIETDDVTLSASDTVANVSIQSGMTLQVNGMLTVNGDTTVSGAVPGELVQRSTLRLLPFVSPLSYVTSNLTVSDGALVSVFADTVLDVLGTFSIDETSRLGQGVIGGFTGNGFVNLFAASGNALVNDGTISPAVAGFTINQNGGGLIDLDGNSDNGIVDANITDFVASGNLTINGTELADSFSGTIALVNGGFLDMNLSNGWTADANSQITISGFSGLNPAELNGGDVNIGGEIVVSPVGFFRITANATFLPTVDVQLNFFGANQSTMELTGATTVEGGLFTLGEDANLDFNGPTTISGGTFTTFSTIISDGDVDFNGPTTWAGTATINGIAQQQGDATVSSSSVINADAFDMDGSLGSTAWDINARLEVHATRIGNGGSVFNGTLDIGGQLSSKLLIDVENSSQPEWEMAGTMNLGGIVLSFVDRLLGSRVNITGELNVTNRAGIAADAVLANASTININSGVVSPLLRMSGETTVEAGATFAGTGTLENGVSGVMSLAVGLSTGQVGVTNHGRLALGDTVGVVVVDRFENIAGATLVVDVGKNNVATDSDLLRIGAGLAELAGSLQPRVVQLSGKNEPLAPGDSFTVITAFGGVIQTFDDVLPSLQGGLTFQWDVTYNPSDVVIEFASVTGLLGDYDYDGVVDGYDFLKWQRTLGSTTNLMADGNLDGMVNQPDLKIWEDNYGSVLPLEAMNVPEPTAMLLTCVVALMLPRRLRA